MMYLRCVSFNMVEHSLPSKKHFHAVNQYFGSMRTKLILPVWSLFSQHKHYLFCSKSWCVVKHNVCVINPKHMLVHFCAQCCIWHHILTLLFVECTHLLFWRNSHIKVLSLPPTISLSEASCLQEAHGGGRDLFMFFLSREVFFNKFQLVWHIVGD